MNEVTGKTINPLDFDLRLATIAKPRQLGPWTLCVEVIPKFSVGRRYLAKEGRVELGVYIDDYPAVILYHDFERGLTTMDNFPWNQESFRPAVEAARGRVLSCGQGIGLLPLMCLDKLNSGIITSFDIVDIDKDIIEITGGYTKNFHPNINIILSDAWKYLAETEEKYDFIFWDCGPSCATLTDGEVAKVLAKRLLNPNGAFKWWLQEIQEKLTIERGKPNFDKYGKVPCRLCGKRFHSSLHGGLCLECSEEYEGYIQASRLLDIKWID